MKTLITFICLIPTLALAKSLKSPYVKQMNNQIKAITQKDLEGLKKGSGMPFGGMAKAAELNGLPGPRHVLDMSQQVKLTKDQQRKINKIFNKMNSEARKLGAHLIKIERQMDDQMKSGKINSSTLNDLVNKSATVYGKLRYSHLVAHLQTKNVLTKKQIDTYNKIRGYNTNNPCKNIPKGHPKEMWKNHHGCQ